MAALISGQLSKNQLQYPLSFLQSCTSSSKYLFYLVLWDLYIKFIRVFGGIWQYNVENRHFYYDPRIKCQL